MAGRFYDLDLNPKFQGHVRDHGILTNVFSCFISSQSFRVLYHDHNIVMSHCGFTEAFQQSPCNWNSIEISEVGSGEEVSSLEGRFLLWYTENQTYAWISSYFFYTETNISNKQNVIVV